MASLDPERTVQQTHACRLIAGLDEAGRGALAGPVVASAVMLPLDNPAALAALSDVNDSKQLSAKRREALFDLVQTHALAIGVGSVSAEIIDQIGILPATRRAMLDAIDQLHPTPDFLLIDGRVRLKTSPLPQQSLVRGDSLSLSIAAASIIAKVTRDRVMIALDEILPDYGFARHKGYGTEQHRHAIEEIGPSAEHRHSFAPIRKPLL